MINSLIKLYEGANISGAVNGVVYVSILKTGTIKAIDVLTDEAVVGANAVFSVSKNGAVIAGLSPTIAVGAKLGTVGNLNIAVAKGDEIILNLVSGAVSSPVTLNLDVDDGAAGTVRLVSSDPSLAPTVAAGYTEAQFNSSNNKFWLWNGTAWRSVDTILKPTNDEAIANLTGLRGWYAARKVATTANGTLISTWENSKTGTGIPGALTPYAAGQNPVFHNNVINGMPVMRCFSTGKKAFKGTIVESFLGTASFSVFMVIRFNSLNQNSTIPDSGDCLISNDDGTAFSGGSSTQGQAMARSFDGSAKDATTAGGVIAVNTNYLFEIHGTGATFFVRANGVSSPAIALGTRTFQSNPSIFGAGSANATGTDVDIAEIILTNVETSPADKTNIRNALASIYAVTV